MDQLPNKIPEDSIESINQQFRLYYNHTMYPELKRLERNRLRLLWLLGASMVFLLLLLGAAFWIDILAFTLFLIIPISFYLTYLVYQIRVFKIRFKPRIVNLLIDFLDDLPNIQYLKYDPKKKISLDRFLESGIFVTQKPEVYKGEDFIQGAIGELRFELSELFVREISPVRTQLDDVFQGIFLHAITKFPSRGSILMIPQEKHKFLNKPILAFTKKNKGARVKDMLDETFGKHFYIYASSEAIFQDPKTGQQKLHFFFPPALQANLATYREATGKQLYAAFQGEHIYIAVVEEKDILEPYIFRSNVNFQLIRSFFEDILLLLLLVNRLDETH